MTCACNWGKRFKNIVTKVKHSLLQRNWSKLQLTCSGCSHK